MIIKRITASCLAMTIIGGAVTALPQPVRDCSLTASAANYYEQNVTISNGNDKGNVYFNGAIYGYRGSTAQAYAEKFGYKFEAFEEPEFTVGVDGSIEYRKYSDHIEITKCSESIIPDKIEDLPVTAIRAYAYAYNESITEVTIPKSVTRIDDWAFSFCPNLKKIIIKNSDCEIADSSTTFSNYIDSENNACFDGTISCYRGSTAEEYAKKYDRKYSFRTSFQASSLNIEYKEYEDHVVVVGHVSSILQPGVVIPSEYHGKPVTEIGSGAFCGDPYLKSVIIPDTVTIIGSGAFDGCRMLSSVSMEEGLTSIGSHAFCGCELLRSIKIPESVSYIGEKAFYRSSCLSNFETNYGSGICVVNGILVSGEYAKGDLMIPFYVSSISGFAFENNKEITSVTIPDTVTKIYSGAFSYCEALSKVTILNPDCEIALTADVFTNESKRFDGTIYGYEGSTAQAYAEKFGYNFESLGEAPEQTEYKKGDANCDGEVTVADATAIIQYLGNSDKYPLSSQGVKNADADASPGITVGDAVAIQRFIAGTIEKFPE